MLSDKQIKDYHKDGLIIPDYRLPESVLEAMRTDLLPFLTEGPDKAPDFVPDLMATGFGLKFGRISAILDMVEQVIGHDIALWASGLFGKPAQHGKETPWHQDSAYWPIRPMATCTVWIALDESSRENGCLRYVPGSHRAIGALPHERTDRADVTLNQLIRPKLSWDERARYVELGPGQMSFHDAELIHGSAANRSPRRRAGVTLRYMPLTSHYDHHWAAELHRMRGVPDISQRVLYIVRGHDRYSLNPLAIPCGSDYKQEY